ncbi:MAG: DNA topoisomerase I [Spirochaetes bacterium GWD1_61_31]|nr:MAG: DNA topoisomerase I [Spirochaetes bacterium GWB1_60_80]OHD34747.1 MAG: DNA topoisomerase I [Spirochaetes bacterium GWC1_61_12]OHD38762.1 MAG: DNA topoisomerase I [Spirochaetes bacterium GWD1_61_31]OHD44577.1 MAG: DNA topoisomerase I [Spirochaetes bacterium GWE1_60_18]OHD59389.1 MAG: DNA topoisomerase I [Spirochaetes bacterium GWF1_60_12]
MVIVESPAKAKTIEKYLGNKYTVLASMGHLIDLPKSRMGVDVEHDFTPEYLTIRGKAKLLKDLQKEAKKSCAVMLASDNDREGEAIAYHIRNALVDKLPDLQTSRIVFNEITPQAIRDAVQSPHSLDEDKVNAQKARRVLDRVVGYSLSPLLWKKVKNGLSAGRVQSVALRIICEREREVEQFIPEEYWSLEADFKKGRYAFSAELAAYQGERPALRKESDVQAIINAIDGQPCVVADVREAEKTVRPKPPFTTSTLQQTAANRLGFTSKKTMQLAQQLYEGIALGSTRIGLITYMRTDSVRLSDLALQDVRAWIGTNYPVELPGTVVPYATSKKAEDAHEAIRPTMTQYTPDSVAKYLSKDQLRLYTIIWERFVACQMIPARLRSTTVDIAVGQATFRVSTSRVVEKGFQKVIKLLASKEDKEVVVPELRSGEELNLQGYRPEQHFTQGPARFTDASIIKMLEEKGIGRPSTYAPIISVLLERYYVTRDNKQLVPTALGLIINDLLVASFPDVVDTGFTAGMETMLDEVEDSKRDWVATLKEFYGPFKLKVENLMETLASVRGKLDEPTDKVCEKCGKPMVKKLGRFGFFLACSGFPECRNTKSVPLARCPRPDCSGEIVARRKTKGRGREFYGCSRFPDCDFVTYFKPTNTYCPKCGWFLVERFDKKQGSHKACINPTCDYLHLQGDEHVPEN